MSARHTIKSKTVLMGVEILSHCYLQKCMKACLILLISGSLFAQTTLNMSQDLVAKKIASTNLTPDTPTLDARPLFEAAAAYASQNNIATLIADPGRYYFLSLHNPN